MAALTLPVSPTPLAPLTAAQMAAVERETAEAVQRILTHGALSANTRRSYEGALRYWAAWHVAAWDTPLPLLHEPRAAVPPSTVRAFIAHHAPERDGDRITTAMPAFVRERLHALHTSRRYVARRDDADADVPTLATVRHRVAALNALHRMLGLAAPIEADPSLKLLLTAARNVAAQQAPAVLRQPKHAITRDLLNAMLARCDEDESPIGLRDAALLACGWYTGGRRRGELASMRWRDLSPWQSDQEGLAGWLWHVQTSKGRVRDRADGGVLAVVIAEIAADRLDRWRDWCAAHGADMRGPVWRSLRWGRGAWRMGAVMDGEAIAGRVKAWVAACGLDPEDYAAHSLRSGAGTTFLAEGGDLAGAADLLAHRSMETTRLHYDHRQVPVAAVARLVRPPRR